MEVILFSTFIVSFYFLDNSLFSFSCIVQFCTNSICIIHVSNPGIHCFVFQVHGSWHLRQRRKPQDTNDDDASRKLDAYFCICASYMTFVSNKYVSTDPNFCNVFYKILHNPDLTVINDKILVSWWTSTILKTLYHGTKRDANNQRKWRLTCISDLQGNVLTDAESYRENTPGRQIDELYFRFTSKMSKW